MKNELRPLEPALQELLGFIDPVGQTEVIDTIDAAGRILAQPVVSDIDVPPMDNTQMDGYVMNSADVADGAKLAVSQRIPAGHVGEPLAKGTAARIFTGAGIPPGADAVVMQEQVTVEGEAIVLGKAPESGAWVRRRGEDIAAGGEILPAGTRLSPQAVGLAASVGLPTVTVRRKVRVACFFTGDELTMPGEPLKPGAIYNSNRYVLVSLLRALGCEVHDLGIVPDSLDATRAALREAAASSDLIVTSGGVSVGEEDHVKPAVEAEGELRLWKLNIKPGKPFAYGQVRRDDQPAAHFVGLPGNPVSSFVTFLLLVRPLILKLAGVSDTESKAVTLTADFTLPRPDRRREFLRARINEAGKLELYTNQSSAVLTSTVWGHGLIDNPPGGAIEPGQPVRFLSFDELLN
ncbi:MAG: gephyrin-like molybdotransferase Glp [Burkholderiaceae bacterium]